MEIYSDGQGFGQPLRVRGKGQEGLGQGQNFHTPAKPLTLTRVRGLFQGSFKGNILPKVPFIWLQKWIVSIEMV